MQWSLSYFNTNYKLVFPCKDYLYIRPLYKHIAIEKQLLAIKLHMIIWLYYNVRKMKEIKIINGIIFYLYKLESLLSKVFCQLLLKLT